MAGTASQQCEAILLGMAQASEADLHASRYHGNAMLPMIVGGLGVGLIALRAIDALRERSMTRKAENLLCEVAPATRSNGKDSPACGPTYRNVIAEKEFPRWTASQHCMSCSSAARQRTQTTPVWEPESMM